MLIATTAVRPVLILLLGCLLLVKVVPVVKPKLVPSIVILLFVMHILFPIIVDY
jgi:hypothetical protein